MGVTMEFCLCCTFDYESHDLSFWFFAPIETLFQPGARETTQRVSEEGKSIHNPYSLTAKKIMLHIVLTNNWHQKTTPVRFELTRAMHNRLAGDPVNHSGKVPLLMALFQTKISAFEQE